VATVVGERNRIMDDPNQFVLDKVENLAEINRGLYTPVAGLTGGLGALVRGAMGAALGVGIARGIGSVLGLTSPFQNKLETAAMGIGILKASAVAEPVKPPAASLDAVVLQEPARTARLADGSYPYQPAPAPAGSPAAVNAEKIAPLLWKKYKATGGQRPVVLPTSGVPKTGSIDQDEARQAFRVAFIKSAYDAGYFHKTAPEPKTASIGFSAVSVSPGMLLAIPQAASNALMLGSRATGAAAGALDAPSADDEQEAQLEATRDLLRQRLSQAKALKAETSLRQLLAKRKR
jgi:hypothetical protein